MKKVGRKIKTIACLPKGVRRDTKWELPIRMAMESIANGKITQSQYDDMKTLSEMTRRTTDEPHLIKHADSLDRILKPIGERGGVSTGNEAASCRASVKVLLDYIAGVHNSVIAKVSMDAIREATC
jgi:hypothetical protein